MIAVYIFIICFSAGLAAWAGLRLWQRVKPLLGNPQGHSGSCAVLPVIAFLIVVGAPASVLLGALASLLIVMLNPHAMQSVTMRIVWAAAMVGLALIFITPPQAKLFGVVPLPVLYGASFVIWVGVIFAWVQTAKPLQSFALIVIFTCLPLAFTPLLIHKTSSVATDAAIIASAWLGALLVAKFHDMSGIAAQLAMAVILGYLQITAIWQGAWIAGGLSIAVWLGAIFIVAMQHAKYDHERIARILPYA